MRLRTASVSFMAIWALATSDPAFSQSQKPLTTQEKQAALEIEQAAVVQARSNFLKDASLRNAANDVTTGPEYITGISAMPAADGAPRVAQVTRYQYTGGITVHTFVDLDSGKALSVKPYVHFPTPLSEQELARAKQLALTHVPEIASALVTQRGADLQVDALTMIVSSPSQPNYGHRIAKLHYRYSSGKPVDLPPVHVDLTEGTAHAHQ